MSAADHAHHRKTVLITGATSGIGREAALLFAKNGWDLILINRSQERSEELKASIQKQYTQVKVSYYLADFYELVEVRNAALEILQNHHHVDALINNAGVIDRSGVKELSNGLEPNFSVNFMATVLLTQLLQSLFHHGGSILMISSEAHKVGRLNTEAPGKSWFQKYGNSKLAVNLYANHVAPRWSEKGVFVNSMHPGVVGTSIFFNTGWTRKWMAPLVGLFMKSASRAATEYISLITETQSNQLFGKYFKKGKPAGQSSRAYDKQVQEALHKWTMGYLKANHLL